MDERTTDRPTWIDERLISPPYEGADQPDRADWLMDRFMAGLVGLAILLTLAVEPLALVFLAALIGSCLLLGIATVWLYKVVST